MGPRGFYFGFLTPEDVTDMFYFGFLTLEDGTDKLFFFYY